MWSMPSPDRRACCHRIGQKLARWAFRLCQVWKTIFGTSALRETRTCLLRNALPSIVWQFVLCMQSSDRWWWWAPQFSPNDNFIIKTNCFFSLSIRFQFSLHWTRHGAFIISLVPFATAKWRKNRNSTNTMRSRCARNATRSSQRSCGVVCGYRMRIPWRSLRKEGDELGPECVCLLTVKWTSVLYQPNCHRPRNQWLMKIDFLTQNLFVLRRLYYFN